MEAKLTAERRDGSGKGVARKLRAIGRVPGVLYGHGMDPVSLAVDAKDLYHVLHTAAGANVLVDLSVDGDSHLALPREVQRDHIKGQFLHVDFLAIRRDERITVEVPVRLVGEAAGVKAGGVLEHKLWDLRLECLPMDVPEAIEADVSALEIGDGLRVSDIAVPENVMVLSELDETVVSVQPPQVLRLEPELEEGEVPEGEVPEGEELEEGEVPEGEAAEAPSEGGGEGAPEEGGER